MNLNLKIQGRAPYTTLFQRATNVTNLGEARSHVLQLIRLMRNNDLEGLSANQCGLTINTFVTNVKGDHVRVFINPTMIIVDYDENEFVERCASFPRNKKGVLRLRHAHVIVEALNYKGDKFTLDTTDAAFPEKTALRLSATLQHEMEHLHGLDIRNDESGLALQKALPDLDSFEDELRLDQPADLYPDQMALHT